MRTLALVGAALIASCSTQNDNICARVPNVEEDVGSPTEIAQNMRDPIWLERRAANCIHRWGYRLAASKDDGQTVAKAVMQACEGAVTSYVDAYAAQMADDYQGRYAPGVVTQEERESVFIQRNQEKSAQLEREAHFRVQQGRAGKCRAPA